MMGLHDLMPSKHLNRIPAKVTHDLQEQVPAPEQQGNSDALMQQLWEMQEYASGLFLHLPQLLHQSMAACCAVKLLHGLWSIPTAWTADHMSTAFRMHVLHHVARHGCIVQTHMFLLLHASSCLNFEDCV